MISVAVWCNRVQAALGREPRSVEEALEGLRKALKDEVSKKEFFEMARRQGDRFESFSRNDRVALVVWAALKVALEKTRRYLDQKNPSTVVVRKDPKVKEGSRRVIGTWRSPEGRVYEVLPWDIRPKKGTRDPWATHPDRRVADAKAEVMRFLSSGEEVRGVSKLEAEAAVGGNPHFSEGYVSTETVNRLEKVGLSANPYDLEGLVSLAATLSDKEQKLKEGIRELCLLRSCDGVAIRKPGIGWETKVSHGGSLTPLVEALIVLEALVEALQGEWTVSEVRESLRALEAALEPADAKRLSSLLEEVGALRLLKVELHRAGYAPVLGVAYRDPATGEVVYTAPVYG